MPSLGHWSKTDYGVEGSNLLPDQKPEYLLLETNKEKSGPDDNRPDYILKAANGAELGAGFEKTSRSENRYISVSYDNATTGVSYNFNLIDRGRGSFEAIYSNKERSRSYQAAAREQETQAERQSSPPESTPTKAARNEKQNSRAKGDQGLSM